MKRFLKFILPCGIVDLAKNRRKLRDIGRRLSPREVLKSDRLVLDAQQSGLSLFATGHVGKLRTVVDVGANTGQWSGMLLNLVRPEKLVIVEPLPDAFAVLQKKFGNNRRVQLHNLAIGERESVVSYRSPATRPARHSFSRAKKCARSLEAIGRSHPKWKLT